MLRGTERRGDERVWTIVIVALVLVAVLGFLMDGFDSIAPALDEGNSPAAYEPPFASKGRDADKESGADKERDAAHGDAEHER